MADKMFKTFKAQIRSIDEKEFTVEAVVSDASMDRYGEVIAMEAWKKGLREYKKHPVLLSSHRYSDLESQIGMAEKIWVEDDALVARFKYFVGEGNKQADWGFRLAQKGIAAYSVGFIPKEVERPEYQEGKMGKTIPWRIYKEVELLEVSHVLIPANANARMKSFDATDPIERELAFEVEGKSLDLGCDEFGDEIEVTLLTKWKMEDLTMNISEEIVEKKEVLEDVQEEVVVKDKSIEIEAPIVEEVPTIKYIKSEDISNFFNTELRGIISEELKNYFDKEKNIKVDEKTVEELEIIDNDEHEEVYIKQILEQLDDINKIFRSDDQVNGQGNGLDK